MTGNVQRGKVVVVVLDLAPRHHLITRAGKNVLNAVSLGLLDAARLVVAVDLEG